MPRQAQHIADDVSRGVGLLHLRIRTQLQSLVRVTVITAMVLVSIPVLTLWFSADRHAMPVAAWWKVAAFFCDQGAPHKRLQPPGYQRPVEAQDIAGDPDYLATATVVGDLWREGLLLAVISAIPVFVGLLLAARHIGGTARDAFFLRGRKITTDRDLADLLVRRRQASDLSIGRVPLVKGKETQHILFAGTVGAGKTQAMYALLDQIRQRGDIAIVYDIAGAFIPTHYRPGLGDRIVNPLDARSARWSPWAEMSHPADADRLAASLIPSPGGPNQFFADAARAITSTSLRVLQHAGSCSVLELIRLLVVAPRQEKERRFAGTEIARFYDAEAGRTAAAIDITAANYIRSLRFLQADAGTGGFSVSGFVRSADRAIASRAAQPWLFISSRRKEHEAIKPLITCLLDSAIAAALSLPENLDRRIWIFLDELDSLHQLPSLASALQEGRKHGICIVAGIQDFTQVLDVYGKERGEAILGLFNTKAFFRLNSKFSADYASYLLGEAEGERTEESARYGATISFESLNLGTRRDIEKLVLPTDIMDLPDLRCWIKLPGPYPIAATTLAHPAKLNRPRTHPGFIEADLSQTVAARLRAAAPAGTPAEAADAASSPAATPEPSLQPAGDHPETHLTYDPGEDGLTLHPF